MEKQVIAILAVAAAGVSAVVHLTVAQLRNRQGDDSHQRRGVGILTTLVLILYVLERGLRGTSFKPEAISFWTHMLFALPTAVVLVAITVTGLVARKSTKGTGGAKRIHRLLNKPSGNGALLWLSASILTGLVFVVASLMSSPRR